MRFYHFSGFDPERPHLLSKHQDRIQLSEQPVLLELTRNYAQALEREGHAEWSPRPYGFGALPDGTPLDNVARAVFRDAVSSGALPDEDIFTEQGSRAFLAYLNEPASVGGGAGITRYLAQLHESRPDLQQAFPDLDGPDGSRLTAWAQVFGSATGTVPPALLPLGAGDSADAGHLVPGVNVAGYFKAVLGVGEHARQLVAGLESQGIPVRPTTLHPDASPEDESLGVRGTTEDKAAFNLLCVNADVIAAVAKQLVGDFYSGGYTIGYWAWEVSAFPPEWLGAFSAVNEVWVGSAHVHDAVAAAATVPVVTIPQPVSLPERSESPAPPARAARGLPLPVRLRLLQRVRAQEPARRRGGVHARLRAGLGRGADRQVAEPRSRSRQPRAPAAGGCRPPGRSPDRGAPRRRASATASSTPATATCRCTARRGSATRWPRRCGRGSR